MLVRLVELKMTHIIHLRAVIRLAALSLATVMILKWVFYWVHPAYISLIVLIGIALYKATRWNSADMLIFLVCTIILCGTAISSGLVDRITCSVGGRMSVADISRLRTEHEFQVSVCGTLDNCYSLRDADTGRIREACLLTDTNNPSLSIVFLGSDLTYADERFGAGFNSLYSLIRQGALLIRSGTLEFIEQERCEVAWFCTLPNPPIAILR